MKKKTHPLCFPYRAPELVERIVTQRIRVLELLRLDPTQNRWRAYLKEEPARAFICVYQENVAKPGKPVEWHEDANAIVAVANCTCPYLKCPAAMAVRFASDVMGCSVISIERTPTATVRRPRKKPRR